MPSKPSVIIVPGSFGTPDMYDSVVQGVQSQGYDISAISLPSVAVTPEDALRKPATMSEDAAFIAAQTKLLVDEGKDVILISHSYSGVPVTESSKGLGKKEREANGLKGGIARLGYMTSLVVGLGLSAMEAPYAERERDLENGMDENGYMYDLDPTITAAMVFNDIPEEQALSEAKRSAKHSAVSFGGALTYPGYRDIPCSYLVCELDKILPPKLQRGMAGLIERYGGTVEITSIQAGHAPNASRPESVVRWIVGMCEKT